MAHNPDGRIGKETKKKKERSRSQEEMTQRKLEV